MTVNIEIQGIKSLEIVFNSLFGVLIFSQFLHQLGNGLIGAVLGSDGWRKTDSRHNGDGT